MIDHLFAIRVSGLSGFTGRGVVGNRELGQRGELIATAYLEREGYRILERNYRAGRCEIDIIAFHDDTLVFIEVKTRGSLLFGHPVLSVTPLKKKRIMDVARSFMIHRSLHDRPVRFDVITVLVTRSGESSIEHFEDAFRASPRW